MFLQTDREQLPPVPDPALVATVTTPSPKNFLASLHVASSPVTRIGGTPKYPATEAVWASSPDSTPLYQYLFSDHEDWVWHKTPSGVPFMAWNPNITIPE